MNTKDSFVYALNSKIEKVENDIDIRTESLVVAILNSSDECKRKLEEIKNLHLQKYFFSI